MNGSASSRHRMYRDRRARGALVVKIELDPARIARLIHRGYIAPGAAGDRAALARGVEESLDDCPGVTRLPSPPPQPASPRAAQEPPQRPQEPGESHEPSDDVPLWERDEPLQPARPARGETARTSPTPTARSDAAAQAPQPPQEAAGQIDEAPDPHWEMGPSVTRAPAKQQNVTNSAPHNQARGGSDWWPSDGEICAEYGPRASLYVQAVRDWQRHHRWRTRDGLYVNDRAPIREDFLPPGEATRMRAVGDPIEALRRKRDV